jgi:hypothetical protein
VNDHQPVLDVAAVTLLFVFLVYQSFFSFTTRIGLFTFFGFSAGSIFMHSGAISNVNLTCAYCRLSVTDDAEPKPEIFITIPFTSR